MINNPREKGIAAAKQEEEKGVENKQTKGTPSSSRSQWSGLKDPRVVRVSRSFGGKDRHSKVCTIRGLRDRRVRLSVPTAIQLYDLQDRLGLNQPSKVVDWLLNVAKHEIDQLPPLPISPGSFSQFPQSMNDFQSSFASLVDANKGEDQTQGKSTFWNLNAPSRSEEIPSEKSSWMKRMDQQESEQGTTSNNPSFAGLLNNVMPYNSYYHWDPSNLSLSHLGSHSHGYSIQGEDPPQSHNNFNNQQSSSQLLLCPSGITQSFFSPYVTTSQVDQNPRQINHLQMSQNLIANSVYPLSQPIVRPLQLGLTPNFFTPQNHSAAQSVKGGTSFENDPKATFE
ncbi:hypothetical protein ACHQM5_006661 [Ranunculus cassubicifolius]